MLLWYQYSQQAECTSLLPQLPTYLTRLLPPGIRKKIVVRQGITKINGLVINCASLCGCFAHVVVLSMFAAI